MNALRAFESVSRHTNVSRAADELSVTPPAISHLLRKLEQNLGVKLVERSGRNISLTSTGENLGNDLQAVFQSLRSAVGNVRDSVDQKVVTVNLRPYFAVKWLTPKLGGFWNRYPDIQLHLHHSNDETDFISSNVDFAIEWSRRKRPDVEYHLLVAGELTPVFSPDLCNKFVIRHPMDLTRYPLLRETDHDSWREWFSICDCEIPDNVHSTFIDDSNVRYKAALDGQGIELSCRTLISEDLANGSLVAPFEEYVSDFCYYLVRPANQNLSNAANTFKNWILEQV